MNIKQSLFLTVLFATVLARAEGAEASQAEKAARAAVPPVIPNRTLPEVEPPKTGLVFSANPSPQEFFRARVFEEPLVPVGDEPSAEENRALARALQEYSRRTSPDNFSSLTGFLQQQPKSSWRAALLLNLGLDYYNTAHYSMALNTWKEAWLLAKEASDTKGKAIGDQVAGELAYMYARLGRMNELEPFLKSIAGRTFVGSATEKISGAREGLWNMQHRPEISFRCGPLALQRIRAALNLQGTGDEAIANSASTQQGFSLPQVAELSKKVGLNYQMAFRGVPGSAGIPAGELKSGGLAGKDAGAPRGDFVVPSVVHWKAGHYAAIVRQEGDRYLLQDPTFGNDVWATKQALDAETSGYCLIPPGNFPRGWRAVDTKEGAAIWGKGMTPGSDSRQTAGCTPKSPGASCGKAGCGPFGGGPSGPGSGSPGSGGAGPGGSSPGGGSPDGLQPGMAVSSVHLMLVNLNITDEPVGYSPPVGPSVRFTVRYNHRDAFQPANFTYSNFGQKWTCDWISYITDNPQSLSADVKYYIMGGGTRSFTGFIPATQSFAYEQYDQTLLTRLGPESYQMLGRDGSKLIFSQSDGSIGTARKIFLTQILDPFGNAVTLTYDVNLRLMAIIDAIGQVTTLSYGETNDIYRITKVTDPFGRFATFDYDVSNRLSKITDVIGLTSQFTYEGSGSFINSLITPYGTNSFIRGGAGTTRFLETVYPDGSRDRVEYNQTINIPESDPPASVPRGMSTHNSSLAFRNTYYWSRTACATSYGDYTKAKIYHWLHMLDITSTAGILQSTKEALEGRVWYDYAGQSGAHKVGSINQPSHVGRVLDDGSTQLSTFAYNGFGHVTNAIDPLGREMSYIYSTNGIDLLEVRQTRGANNELLARTTYNAQHLPLTTVDAAGQTNRFAYNARGQLLTETNPRNEATTYTYDTNGYLIAVDGPLPGTDDAVTAAYDSFGRTQTRTDVSGDTMTFGYDAMDRLTNVTHSDSTFEQFIYNRLDLVVIQDRAGRQTLLEFDNMRQMVKRTDPLSRITLFQWCSCGALRSLTDAMGRTTTWDKDVQGRLTSKHYGDGSQVSYFYENDSGRMRRVIDEKQQVTQYTYHRDNTLKSIGYANAAVPTPGVSYTYDLNYQRLLSMTDGTGTTIYSYNAITASHALGAGQLASVDGPLPNDTITHTYDELGRRVSRAINGVALIMIFDAAGRVVGETNALGAFSRVYDGASFRMVSNTFPNGQTTERSYAGNLEDRALQRITHKVGVTPISEFIYGRDILADRITTWSQQAGAQPPLLHTVAYDAADQILSATVTNVGSLVNTFAYTYDPVGNRLTQQVGASNQTATYNALNQISTSTTSGPSRTNEWDAENRLVAVNAGNERTEFAYDGLSRLAAIRHLTNGSQVSFRRLLWCENDVCEERDDAGAVTKRFFIQGMRVEVGPDTGNYYYARDHLGSIREVIDGNGSVRAGYSYDPFGRRTRPTGNLDIDFGFAGMFWASEAGLSLTRFRPYNAEQGRWLSRDPLKDAEMEEYPNLYAYVGNNPVNAVDPLGLCCEDEQLLVIEAKRSWHLLCIRNEFDAKFRCDTEHSSRPKTAVAECARFTKEAVDSCVGPDYEVVRLALKLFKKCAAKCKKGCKLVPYDPVPDLLLH